MGARKAFLLSCILFISAALIPTEAEARALLTHSLTQDKAEDHEEKGHDKSLTRGGALDPNKPAIPTPAGKPYTRPCAYGRCSPPTPTP